MTKNYYALILLTVLLSFTQAFAQFCPPNGFSDGTSLYFFYDTGTSLCAERPITVYVGTSEFSIVDCDNISSVYDLNSGDPIVNLNAFTVDFGFGTCEYTNGTLTNETLSTDSFADLDKTQLRVFPNPVTTGNRVFVDFGSANVNVDITIYSVTGKRILDTKVANMNKAALNVSGLNNGVYMIKIASNTSSVTRKFVIMK
ncbi:MAG TPA: T9SS type A sorting domain-containing protein [Flavobacteriaceae bacterium]|nr:T9SS type A sorting domain-containing protein [Flavobacteriaceae bacterium]